MTSTSTMDKNYAFLRNEVNTLRSDMTEGFSRIESNLELLKNALNIIEEPKESDDEEYPEPVLLPNLVLKDDEFYGMHRLWSPPFPDGVLNFRCSQNSSLPIYGVHQPSAIGIQRVLDYFTQDKGFRRIVWINLREEPVVYISGRPCAPREPDRLNSNVEYLFSIEGSDLEKMERRMQRDVLEEAEKKNGKFPLYQQYNAEGDNNQTEMNISQKQDQDKPYVPGENGVTTLREMFNEHKTQLKQKQNTFLRYCRIPIQDECAPEEKDFDELVSVLKHETRNTTIILNCQMGRGRTTTGMVVASLLLNRVDPPHNVTYSASQETRDNHCFACSSNHSHSMDYTPRSEQRMASRALTDLGKGKTEEQKYLNGCYMVIEHLVSVLDDGVNAKCEVDEIIDDCDAMQNLREAIFECKQKAEDADRVSSNQYFPLTSETVTTKDGRPASFWYNRGHNYLERYWWILVFNAYVHHQSATGFRQKFSRWMGDRWGLKRMLKKLSLA